MFEHVIARFKHPALPAFRRKALAGPLATRPRVEELESRVALSFVGGLGADAHAHEIGASPARGKSGANSAPVIKLQLVALHEFGHSLGLEHTEDPNSIMYPFYNPSYDVNNFHNDSAVLLLRLLYATPNTGPWKDEFDYQAGDGQVDLTYGWMPDGTTLDGQASNGLFATFNRLYGDEATWKGILVGELERWASVSGGMLTFAERADAGREFDYPGLAQSDPDAGEIRIGTHVFDGPGGVLAHAFVPIVQPIFTGDGDVHFDQEENWDGRLSGSGKGRPDKGNGRGAFLSVGQGAAAETMTLQARPPSPSAPFDIASLASVRQRQSRRSNPELVQAPFVVSSASPRAPMASSLPTETYRSATPIFEHGDDTESIDKEVQSNGRQNEVGVPEASVPDTPPGLDSHAARARATWDVDVPDTAVEASSQPAPNRAADGASGLLLVLAFAGVWGTRSADVARDASKVMPR